MSARVSVVIVNWNTRELLARCLETLRSDVVAGLCEVLVVDNDSRDGSPEMVAQRFPWVVLIRNATNAGFARGVNQGFRRARGEHVLLLNSDTEVAPGAIRTAANYLDAHPDVAIAGCRMTFPDGRVQSSCFRFPSLLGVTLEALWLSQLFPASYLLNWSRYGHREWKESAQVDCVMGSFQLIRRSAIDGDDLFDEGYFVYGEETDLCLRLRKKGLRVMFLPDASIVHVHGGSTKTPAMSAWAYEATARGVLRFFLKWRGTFVAWLANLIMLLGTFPRLVAWAAADVVGWLRSGGRFAWRQALKARILRLHVAALVSPSLLGRNWSGPDAARPTDR